MGKTVGKKIHPSISQYLLARFPLLVRIQFIYLTGDEEKDWASGKNVDRNVEYLRGERKIKSNKNTKKIKKIKRGERFHGRVQ